MLLPTIQIPETDDKSEEELKDAYVSVRNLFNDLTDEEKRQLINLYLDKLVMYEDYVEMYLNCGEVVEY